MAGNFWARVREGVHPWFNRPEAGAAAGPGLENLGLGQRLPNWLQRLGLQRLREVVAEAAHKLGQVAGVAG